MNTKFQLEMLEGPTPGNIYDIDKDQIVGGREPSCDIVINDAEISRNHFRLIWREPGYILEDLGSTNGILVNDVRMNAPQGLHGGEKLSLGGNVVLEYKVIPIELEETIVAEKEELASDAIRGSEDPIAVEPGDIIPEPLSSELDLPEEDNSISEEPGMVAETNPPLKRSNKKKYILISMIVILIIIIGLIFIYLYNAPTSFWCDNFSFIFKPAIYPDCIP
jgi:pSer/pThr/pTyr-binding forkhead associated (FHA) protein